jgi:hypothetical protein
VEDHEVFPAAELREVFGAAGSVATAERIGHVVVASATRGLWRVRAGDRSVVLKLLAHSADGSENWRSGEAEDDWYYWRREAEAYGSGLLRSFAGRLRPSACHLIAERDDGTVALWLEDLQGEPAPAWPLPRYGVAARDLGRAQGEFVAGRPLPVDAWLSRGWLRDYVRRRDRDLALLTDRAAWTHPLVATWFPDPPIDELLAMRAAQKPLLAVLDGMPATVSHLDLHPANMFDASGDTAVVDWSFVGIAALGEDAGNLVPDSVFDFHVAPEHLDDLYATVAEGYHAGLRAAGWDGTLDEVRLAMAASMVAKYAWIAPAILRAAVDGRDHLNRRPIAAALRSWAPTVHFLLARAAEAATVAADRP